MRVAAIREGKDCQHVLLHLAPGTAKLPEMIRLAQTRAENADNPNIALGRSLYEEVVVNLDSTPHMAKHDALSVLSGLFAELENRKELFRQISQRFDMECSCLADFNRLRPENPLPRRLIVIDEPTELTDTTGMDKEHKELAARIINKLSTIARLGRAYGVNLVIGEEQDLHLHLEFDLNAFH